MDQHRLQANLDSVRARMTAAAQRAGAPGSVRLVAVTKRAPVAWVRPLIELGVADLGENYPQELWNKAETLADLPSIRWHLIGHLQSNKARRTLPLVQLVHGVDSLRLLRVLDELAAHSRRLPSGEHVGRGAQARLGAGRALGRRGGDRGVSAHPDRRADDDGRAGDRRRRGPAGVRPVARLRDQLQDRMGRPLPELSMGMSGDFEAAIAEGATLVRVGSALFEGIAP